MMGGAKFVGRASEVAMWIRAQADSMRVQGKDEPLFEAKLRKRKRTLTQNAYYWELLGKLAAKLGMGNDEVHGLMLRSYGCYDVFTVREDVPLASYFRYFDVVGEHVMDGRRYLTVRAFKGSSEMDSGEFSRLIDGMRQECEQQGIQVMTPSEMASLKFVEGAA